MIDRRGHRSVPVAAPLTFVVTALLAACGTAPTPSSVAASPALSAPPTVAPATVRPATVAPSTTPPVATQAAQACIVADLKASHGLIEGAAGSRITEVVLVAATACSIDAFPTLGLRDANGTAVVGGVAGGPGRIDLSPDASYSSNVRLANWCVPDPAFPLALELRIGGDALAVTGSSFPEEGDLPPCNGEGGPILEGSAWTPGT